MGSWGDSPAEALSITVILTTTTPRPELVDEGPGEIETEVGVAELAVEKGSETILVPVSARRQLNELSDEMAAKLTVLYYTDARDALLKTVGE